MAQKLNADLNIIQRSGIEVQIDPITADLNIIQKLDDEPNDVGGLSAQQLKAKFDEAGNIIKTFINDSLIPQVLGDGLTEQNRQENELARQANEETRQENEAARVQAEAAREQTAIKLNKDLTESVNQLEENIEAAEEARNVWEDYDPTKDYVSGNKVYYLGSSYVNKAACKDVLPTVEANWQMIAKKGADGSGGMSQDEADLRYLQLSGGRMTGEMRVQAPTRDDNPATKEYVDNAPPGGFRHMVIFQESGMFDPAAYGLEAGDIVSVTVVGGGGGGGVVVPNEQNWGTNDFNISGGDAGKKGNMHNVESNKTIGDEGNGYGAGGGGASGLKNYPGSGGGGSGHVTHKVVKLTSVSPIPVTVGAPGIGSKAVLNSIISTSITLTPGSNGGTSSFGTFVSSNGGECGYTAIRNGSEPGPGGNGEAKGGTGGYRTLETLHNNGGMGGRNGSNGGPGGVDYYSGPGGGGGGGYIIPFSALVVEIIGELVPGAGVVVVAW